MLGYASSGRRRNHSQVAEPFNRLRRVVTGIGGYFLWYCAGVADGFLNHAYGLLFVRGLAGGAGRHDDLAGMVHHRLTVVGLQEVPATRRGHDAGLSVGEVALGLVVGHPWVLAIFGLGLFRRRLCLGFQRRHGDLRLGQLAAEYLRAKQVSGRVGSDVLIEHWVGPGNQAGFSPFLPIQQHPLA